MATNTGQYTKGSGASIYGTPIFQVNNSSMMSTGNQSTSGLLSSIRNTQSRKEQEKQRIETAQSTQRTNDTVSLYGQSLMSTSEPLKKQYSVSSRGSELASMIVEMGKEKGITYTGNDKEVIDSYLKQNPGQSKALYDFTHGNIDAEAFANQMKWLQEDNQLMTPAPWLNDTSVGIAGAGLGAVGVDRLGALMEWGGDKIYKMPIDSSINESKKIQASKVSLKDAEAELKSAKSKLSAAKKSGKGVKEAQQLVDLAEIKVKAAKGTKVRTVADSAKDYNVGGGIIEGWTDQSRGVQAKHEANQIFKETIEPALEKSTAKVNVQNLINELSDDVERLAKNDPDKLEAYKSALEDLKKSYKSKEFAEYSLKDAQTLKSGLQGRTPQKFWKGKEITNELQELKGILSTKLKNVIHSNLTKEIGEDSAKMYLDYANLSKYADDMAKSATNSGLKGGAGSFLNTVFHKLTDGAFAKVGLTLDNGGKLLQRPRKILSDGIKYISNNYQKVFKPSTAGKIRVTDPVGMLQLMQAGGELRDSMLGGNTTYGDIADAIGDIPVIQAYDTLSAISEMKSFRDDWNSSDDNGRIDILLDTLGDGYSRKDAENYYNFWKEQQGSKDGTIQSGMGNPLSKSMPA